MKYIGMHADRNLLHWRIRVPLNELRFNTLRSRQNGRHFADDAFKRIFLYENVKISIKMSPTFVPKGSINNVPVLFQIMDWRSLGEHCSGFMMSAMVSPITGVLIVYLTVCSGVYPRKHQSSTSLAFMRAIHRWPVNIPHKRPVTRKMFHFMTSSLITVIWIL